MQLRLIIGGGRKYRFTMYDRARLGSVRAMYEIIEVVSGRATGADKEGENWADANGIPVKPFPADWDDLSHPDAIIRTRADGSRYDVRAGFRRNEEMACYANAAALFPGGTGTADMYDRARAHGLLIFDWRQEAAGR